MTLEQFLNWVQSYKVTFSIKIKYIKSIDDECSCKHWCVEFLRKDYKPWIDYFSCEDYSIEQAIESSIKSYEDWCFFQERRSVE